MGNGSSPTAAAGPHLSPSPLFQPERSSRATCVRTSSLNWLWLVDLPPGPVCEIVQPWRASDPGLKAAFERVERISADLRTGSRPFQLPFADGEASLVVLHDLLLPLAGALDPDAERDEVDRRAVRILRECRRGLREGGCVYLTVENGHWHGRLLAAIDPRRRSRFPAADRRRVRRWLEGAGFRGERFFFVSPNADFPAPRIVPATRSAVLAHERLTAGGSFLYRLGRRLAVAIGTGSLLFRGLIAVGVA